MEDSTRLLHEDFSSIELESRVQQITKFSSALLESPVVPFSVDRVLSAVCGFSSLPVISLLSV